MHRILFLRSRGYAAQRQATGYNHQPCRKAGLAVPFPNQLKIILPEPLKNGLGQRLPRAVLPATRRLAIDFLKRFYYYGQETVDKLFPGKGLPCQTSFDQLLIINPGVQTGLPSAREKRESEMTLAEAPSIRLAIP
jgi:hypothetical protein